MISASAAFKKDRPTQPCVVNQTRKTVDGCACCGLLERYDFCLFTFFTDIGCRSSHSNRFCMMMMMMMIIIIIIIIIAYLKNAKIIMTMTLCQCQ